MKTKLLGVFCLVLWCSWTMAQHAQNGVKHEGSGSFNIGYVNLGNSDFQQFLPGDFNQISENYLLLGGEGYGLKGNFLFGISGQAIIGQDESHGEIRTEVSGGMGFLNFGYAVVSQDKIKLFPMLGIGVGGMELSISEVSEFTLSEIIEDPGREITLNVGNFMLDFSLGLDYIPSMQISENGKEGGGFKTGIRIGYILGFNNDKWEYGGGEVRGAPDFGMNAFYVKLIIGGHGFSVE